jgi:hypothetical protein
VRALLLGNSQIVSYGSLPAIIARLSASAPPAARVAVEHVAIGGASIETLWNDGRPLAAIRAGGWDRVLFHEIVYSYGGNGDRLREYGGRFAAEARLAGAQPVVYASGDVAGSATTHAAMHADAAGLARTCAGRVAGGGAAWLLAWAERPELDFHCPDRAHAGELGYYLNACVVYAALTGASPVGLDPGAVDAGDADFLQRIAWRQSGEDRRAEAPGGDHRPAAGPVP